MIDDSSARYIYDTGINDVLRLCLTKRSLSHQKSMITGSTCPWPQLSANGMKFADKYEHKPVVL